MSNSTENQKTALDEALDEFNRISDTLAVPTMKNPLPTNRQWSLPNLDEKVLADLPKHDEAVAKEETAS